MPGFDWNDLKFALAVQRQGSLAAAARVLSVNETTVARRIRALEHALNLPLFVRGTAGRQTATEHGLRLLEQAEAIEGGALDIIQAAAEAREELTGTVRVTSVPFVINRMLVPALPELTARHPRLRIELVPDSSNLSLTRREADLALRMARPAEGGSATLIRKAGEMEFGLFRAKGTPEDLPLISYDSAHAHLPQAKWLESRIHAGAAPAGLRVTDLDTAFEAAAAGIGQTLLPLAAAQRDPRLQHCAAEAPLPRREVWLVSHAEQRRWRGIQAVRKWLLSLFPPAAGPHS
jgi:DNA-binding transcriptional LysR family regulator